MVGGGIRERLRLRREAAEADGPRPARRGPGLLAPVLLIVFFLVVVLMVVKMGGGEDDDRAATAGGSRDPSSSASPSAEPTVPATAPAGSVPGTVRSRLALAFYKQASARGKPVLSADHGTKVVVVCHTAGQTMYTSGKADPTWARVIVSGKIGYAHVGQLDTGGVILTQVPDCSVAG